MNVAVGGKYYVAMFDKLVHMGIVGNNVEVHIYADNDGTFDTSVDYYWKKMRPYARVFGKILVHYNMRSKDCGVCKEQISLSTYDISGMKARRVG